MSHEDPRAMACVRLMISFQGCVSVFVFFFKKKDVTEEYETGFSKGETTSNEVERKAQKPARPTRHGGQDVRCGQVGSRRERERERGAGGGGGGEAGAAKHEPTHCACGEHV